MNGIDNQRNYRSDLRDIAMDVRAIATVINNVDDVHWLADVLGELTKAIEQLTEIKAELETE